MLSRPIRSTIAVLSAAVMVLGGAAMHSADSFTASAYDYDTIIGAKGVKGFKKVKYSKVITVNAVYDFGADSTGTRDSAKAIQKALNYARDNSSSSVQVKVILPEGTYSISKTLYVYSNTHLSMYGATIRKDYVHTGCMIRNAQPQRVGKYNDASNIIIEGGCIDGNPNDEMADFSNAKFGHMTNLLVKKVAFKGNLNAHHLELGGIRNVTVEGCDFSDYHGTRLKEAIQFDMMNGENLFGGFEPFDDTSCTNVIIRKNTFHNVMRGIGSHSSTLGSYYTDFLIENNKFTDIEDCAILMQSYKNITVRNNTMNNVGSGIIVRNMSPSDNNVGYNDPVDVSTDVVSMLDNDLNTVISGNTINASVTDSCPSPFGIELFGKLIDDGDPSDFDYQVEGIHVTGNELNVPGTCIVMDDVNGIKLDSNILSYTGDPAADHDLIRVKNSSETLFTGNTASVPAYDGFTVTSGRVYLQDMKFSTSSDGCCGVRSGRDGSVFGWDMEVSSSGNASSPVYAEKGSGNMVISGGCYSASGNDSPAAISESVIAVNAAELKGGSSEAVRVANPGMMYLYDCTLTTDSKQGDGTPAAAATLYGNSPFGVEDKLSRLYVEGGSMTSDGDAIFTTNCKSEVILHSAGITASNGFLINCSSDPTCWGWGRTGSGGAQCSLTFIRGENHGDLGCDSLSELDVYLTDFTDFTGSTVEYSAGDLYGSHGHITMNIDPGSAWIIENDVTVSSLHTAGEVKDNMGLHAVIVDADGNVLRDGKSPFTVTVLEDYSEEPDLHNVGDSYSFEDFRMSRTEIDPSVLDDESDEAAELARGDVNDNGLIDIGDVSMIASYVKGVKEFPDETSELRADVNLDGMVNVKDMMRLAAVIKGIHPL